MTNGATAAARARAKLIDRPLPHSDNISELDAIINRAQDTLLSQQNKEGYWSYQLEADCTIPAEYILMMHYMDEIDATLQSKIAVYLRKNQTADGGWPLYFGGKFDLSCSVKAYFALKFAGDKPEEQHMVKARKAILKHGGAAHANVFTRITLALFGIIPWRGVPFIPVEIMLLPRWFPFHLSKISYWSRAVMVPLLILCSLKPEARNPHKIHIRELFTVPPEEEKNYFRVYSKLGRFFLILDKAGRYLEPFIPNSIRKRAIKKAEHWFLERLNGEGGLGAIFPAMVNAYEALDVLGYDRSHPDAVTAKQALQELLVIEDDDAYCQPCISPVWDTALSCLTLQEVGGPHSQAAVTKALDWLKTQQLLDEPGDWRDNHPELKGGGWPFQLQNSHYPDLDDTGVVGWAMNRSHEPHYEESVKRAADWIQGMQSRNGGFASFDADNNHMYLNEIPFADHGALLDPPTEDVSARCLTLLSRLVDDNPQYKSVLESCTKYLLKEQQPDGSWYGRWGTNYVYGTWSVLVAFEQAGIPASDPAIQHAVRWLKSVQRFDGGWGESEDSYFEPEKAGQNESSTAFQTAWAMLGLMAAGEGNSSEVRRGADYLMRAVKDNGLWKDDYFTAPGFPRIFHLKYHGYDKYFPLWALARYRKLNRKTIA